VSLTQRVSCGDVQGELVMADRPANDPLPPGERVGEAVGAVAMPMAGQRRSSAGGVAPGERVGAGERPPVAAEAGGLHAEPVEAEALAGEGGDNPVDLRGGLPAADTSEADQRLGGQVDTGLVVGVDMTAVVVQVEPLENRDPGKLPCQGAEFQDAGDGAPLVLGHAEVGAREPLPAGGAAGDDDRYLELK
jgi:hypothetical protein